MAFHWYGIEPMGYTEDEYFLDCLS